MSGCALSLAFQRIRAGMSPPWNSVSVSVFDSLGFRSFTSEPGENCPSAEEGISKYNCFSAQNTDALLYKGLLREAWCRILKNACRNLVKSAPKIHQLNKQIIAKAIGYRADKF